MLYSRLQKSKINASQFLVYQKPPKYRADFGTNIILGWRPVKTVERWCGISKKTVIDWYNFCRDVCAEFMLQHSDPIGGPGTVVEVDEAKFGKRKYNRGHLRDGKWVLGGIERGTDNVFMVVIPNKAAATLISIIQNYVKPGSTIHTNELLSYSRLGTLGYVHQTVDHSTNFVDLITGAYTQNIECSWAHYKSKYKRMHVTSSDLFPTYLIEYM